MLDENGTNTASTLDATINSRESPPWVRKISSARLEDHCLVPGFFFLVDPVFIFDFLLLHHRLSHFCTSAAAKPKSRLEPPSTTSIRRPPISCLDAALDPTQPPWSFCPLRVAFDLNSVPAATPLVILVVALIYIFCSFFASNSFFLGIPLRVHIESGVRIQRSR